MDQVFQSILSHETKLKKSKGINIKMSVSKALELISKKLKTPQIQNSFGLINIENKEEIKIIELMDQIKQQILNSGLEDLTVKLTLMEAKQTPVTNEKNKVIKNTTDPENTWIVPKGNAEKVMVSEDEIEGAKVRTFIPKKWNGNVILFAHGFRPETETLGLVLTLDSNEPFIKKILKQGWIVAETSYRRNGRIIREAIQDLNNLRKYIMDHFGDISLCVIEGRSMGGCIATHIAEMYPDLYQGCVAIGAALLAKDDSNPLEFEYNPKIPLIFLTNQSELGTIQKYISKCKEQNKDQDIILPALWEVWREGHNLVSQKERFLAMNSLLEWITFQTNITVRSKNILIDYKRKSKSEEPLVSFDSNGLFVPVIQIDPVRSSFFLGLCSEDLAKIQIKINDYFWIKFNDKKVKVFYGTYPFFVSKGSWIAYDHPDGCICVSILDYYGVHFAAKQLGLEVHSQIFISKQD
ncbi:monoacylglycerol lipase [Anaeramoeba ignava]|uniref:Monoacylglycerol lipase n=1 Tax=Anaeramoeba ignava TaxID=1746090 RepID=A0A9Q0R4M0_ANAIG|nr:monoacylglycerol lipase [Anaeramoeba ignava]